MTEEKLYHLILHNLGSYDRELLMLLAKKDGFELLVTPFQIKLDTLMLNTTSMELPEFLIQLHFAKQKVVKNGQILLVTLNFKLILLLFTWIVFICDYNLQSKSCTSQKPIKILMS